MRLIRPLPSRVARVLRALVVVAWLVQMGVLVRHAVLEASPGSLAADLVGYSAAAHWRGVYYRGEKLGFLVSETVADGDGFELQEEGRLQLSLFGTTAFANMKTVVRVDRAFALRSFTFALDPGTGPIRISGALEGTRLDLTIATPSGARTESRHLETPPVLAANLGTSLAARGGLRPGARHEVVLFDPATLRNSTATLVVRSREVVAVAGRPTPAFRVEVQFSGLSTTSWVTDVGEVVREESPMGLIIVRETRDRALAPAVPASVRADLLRAAAVVPSPPTRIDDPETVQLLRVRLEGLPSGAGDLEGAGQSASGDVIEVRDSRLVAPGPADPDASRFLAAEPLIESDDPEIRAEAERAVAGAREPRLRAERLVRHVNAILEQKPTVSLPSAREVLRTRVGDCNEHTALYVALARSVRVPSRVAVGLVYLHGAFYYHAWPEVYLQAAAQRGQWLPVDPTLNQFPADATHIRLSRGDLAQQTAILPMIGRARITVLEVRLPEGTVPVLVGRPQTAERALPVDIPIPRRTDDVRGCWVRGSRAR
jgi:transglutaminase-like putative cysteine protease